MYDAAQTRYKGRCTAPLLIDKKQQKLVSNESSDIMRMLNSVSLPGCNDIDLYPSHLQSEIDEVNDLVYDKVCAALVITPSHRTPPPCPPPAHASFKSCIIACAAAAAAAAARNLL